LTIVVRHAQAQHVDVQVVVDTAAGSLTLIIEDDDVGVGPDDVPGHGTVNLKAWAQRLAGTFVVQPGAQGGGPADVVSPHHAELK
jgi:signal transduction histidine kinase